MNAKNAFSPMPGACANGYRATRPMISEPNAAAMQVTITSCWKTLSTPSMTIAFESTSG